MKISSILLPYFDLTVFGGYDSNNNCRFILLIFDANRINSIFFNTIQYKTKHSIQFKHKIRLSGSPLPYLHLHFYLLYLNLYFFVILHCFIVIQIAHYLKLHNILFTFFTLLLLFLAPEVEYTSRGLGGTYGLPADCWSLGAVLYVMLVARFPEFEQDGSGNVLLRLPPTLWDDVSSDAKDLIRLLMNTNPAAR